MKKLAIFIPAYNAAKTIPTVIDRIPQEIKNKVQEIFIVDNASDDNTYLTVIGYRHEIGLNNLKIIRNEKNIGYGGSQKLAYKYAIEQGYDIVVMLHGDAQYAPEYLPDIIKPLEEDKADLVFGSRMTGDPKKGGMPLWKRFANRLITWFENTVLETNLSEFHSGYRGYSCKALKDIPFDLCADDYHFDTDILVQYTIANKRIDETTIPTHYGKESQSPSMYQLIVYVFGIVSSMSEYWMHKKGIKIVEKYNFGRFSRSQKQKSV
ncbi:MAG: glycosyltransferase family 2 protein [Halobacteriovoraceae bacterium]|nr:glycosyltransferase family 2 protein [Halobacteriovoraceae bacterium]